jgi:hypothetical protein
MASKMLAYLLVLGSLALLLDTAAAGDAEVEEEVNLTPPCPDWASYVTRVLPQLSRRLRIAIPCCGIDGCGFALQSIGWEADFVNIYDLEENYREHLMVHLEDMGMQIEAIILNLGKIAGDLLGKAMGTLQLPVDFLIAGPPCPPWAGQGKKKGAKDSGGTKPIAPSTFEGLKFEGQQTL